ncbi:MAG TPA: sulfurtransferase [Kofleriaceae bacterium]|jgi:thiosulfate/3-mercaptopyruvate sulfurtransferase
MAQTSSPLVDAASLAAQIATGKPPVIFDCRFDVAKPGWGREQYAASHVPGAFYADIDTDLSSPKTPSSGRHPLPHLVAFAGWLGAHGVTPSTPVVAYDQGSGAYAARLWWLLRAIGHLESFVLDGGFAAWIAAKNATTDERRRATVVDYGQPTSFAGGATTGDVALGLLHANIVLVDARAADRYAGNNETIDPVAGHVPGALSKPFMTNMGPDGKFLAPTALREQWTAVLKGRDPGELVAMCGSGVTACHNLLALDIAGLPGARLYAGSWSEWIRDPSRAVATGESPK